MLNLPDPPKCDIKGWSAEERCRHYLDRLNEQLGAKKPWTVAELSIKPFEWERWELLLISLLWWTEACSGGWLREHARLATGTTDTLALQRLLEHVEHFNAKPEKP